MKSHDETEILIFVLLCSLCFQIKKQNKKKKKNNNKTLYILFESKSQSAN